MRRLRSIKALKKEAWTVFARYIRKRDKKCVTCGGPADHAGHFQRNSERKADLGGNELWYDPRNVNAQCMPCNHFKSGNLVAYAIYLQGLYGPDIATNLYKLWLRPKKWTRSEIESVITLYKAL